LYLIHSAGPPALARAGSSCFTSTVTPGRRSANVPFTFVVIAAGGHASFGTKRGDHVVAFALP